MLILTRKLNEEIKIDSEIIIKVISISENSVKLGIEAPKGIQIVRAELYEKIKEVSMQSSLLSKEKPEDLAKLKIKKIS
ncbi:MAG: carbon storage regulator CsrA [Ignavibacteriaceae bacterium]|nr:carbon storage regulator CsrA [Ignavibacteriaceae bacterium]